MVDIKYIKNSKKDIDDFKKSYEEGYEKKKSGILSEYKAKLIAFSSIETFPILRLQALKLYLQDKLLELEKEREEKLLPSPEEDYYFKSLKMVQHIQAFNNNKNIISEGANFNRVMRYGFLSLNCIGRLHSAGVSVQCFSPEIRYYLFHDLYQVVGLKTPHPTILYEYASVNGLEIDCLKMCVQNSESFFNTISDELKKSGAKEEELNIKEEVLKTLEQIRYYGKSKTIRKFHKEILRIREHVWENHFINQNPLLDLSVLKGNKVFDAKNIKKQKIVVQRMYCLSKKAELLLKLKTSIQSYVDEVKSLPRKKKRGRKKTVIVSSVEVDNDDFRFIPFYGSAYVLFKNYDDYALCSALDKFNNDSSALYKFEIKPIVAEWKRLCPKVLASYENIVKFMSNMSFTDYGKLIPQLGLGKFSENFQADLIDARSKFYLEETRITDTVRKVIRKQKRLKKKHEKNNKESCEHEENDPLLVNPLFPPLDLPDPANDPKRILGTLEQDLLFVGQTTIMIKLITNINDRIYGYNIRKILLPYASSPTKLKNLLKKHVNNIEKESETTN
jgi:hypothetical protein